MEQLEVIRLVADRLEKLGTPYFITGSIASSYYGIPRYTHDLDVVITISEEDISAIMRLFEHEGYLSQEGIRDALSGTGMFNFIHIESGLKVDFWIDRGEPFTKSCFERVRQVEISDRLLVKMASPEDVLLHKIYWDHLTPSERQIRDAHGIVAVQGMKLDIDYIGEWAKKLGIEDKTKEVFSGMKPPNLEV